jgi:hypothetical protein
MLAGFNWVNHYKHSGRTALPRVIASAVAGFAAGFPLAFIYAWGIIRISEQHLAGLKQLAKATHGQGSH